MVSQTPGEQLFAKRTATVAVEDQGAGRIAGPRRVHLRDEDVEVTVAVDVRHRQAVAVSHAVLEQGVTDPPRSVPFVPPERSVQVTGGEHHLGPAARHELARRDPAEPHAVVDHLGDVALSTAVFEPTPAADEVALPVAVHVGHGEPLDLGRVALEHRHERPWAGTFHVRRRVRQEQRA